MNNNFLVSEVMMTLEKCPVVSENEILKALMTIKKDKTVIIIAHRLKTIENCDEIIELSKGKISRITTPSEIFKDYDK